MALPIYTHIPNLKVLTKIFFKFSRPKGNLGGGGGVTVLNPKYTRLSSGDTMIKMYTTGTNLVNSLNFGKKTHLQCKIQETLSMFILRDLRRL